MQLFNDLMLSFVSQSDDLSNLVSLKCKDSFVQIMNKLTEKKVINILKIKSIVINPPIRNFIISLVHLMLNIWVYCQIPESQVGYKPQLSKI